jgi:hypothetical protein
LPSLPQKLETLLENRGEYRSLDESNISILARLTKWTKERTMPISKYYIIDCGEDPEDYAGIAINYGDTVAHEI